MEQAEMQAILSHVFNRLQRLATDMSVLQGKEKDLRIIVTEGFAKADQRFDEVDIQFKTIDQRFFAVDQRFERLEDQIDTLAIQTHLRFEILEKRMDNMDGKIDVLDQRTRDTDLKIDKILNYLAIA